MIKIGQKIKKARIQRRITQEELAVAIGVSDKSISAYESELPVASLILVHNHPSGNLEPSKEDLIFTKRVKVAADIIGIKLLDHLIIGNDGWNRIKI